MADSLRRLLRSQLFRQVFDVLREDVRGGGDVQRHSDHGALAGHLEDGVCQVGRLGANLVDGVAVLVILLPAQVLRRGVEFCLADHTSPLVLLFAGRALANTFAQGDTGQLMATYAGDAVPGHSLDRQVFDFVFLRNPEGYAEDFGARLVQGWLLGSGDGAVVGFALHDALHHFLHQVHALANLDGREAVNLGGGEAGAFACRHLNDLVHDDLSK